jgi:hypothetical protein
MYKYKMSWSVPYIRQTRPAEAFIWLHLHAPPQHVELSHVAGRGLEAILAALTVNLCTILNLNF